MAARGEAPNVARLIEMGTAFGHGAMASLPTVTLANHTSIITGAHPGHHGILNNAWFDRAHRRAGHHQLVRRPGRGDGAPHRRASSRSTTRCTARGPTRSPRRSTSRATPAPTTRRSTSSGAARSRRSRRTRSACPHTTERFVRPSKDYSWSSVVDHMGVDQALGILARPLPRRRLPAAALHVVQLHAHRRRDARRRPVLGDGGRVGARQRRPHRRGPRRARAARASFDDMRVRARRRPRHGGERPGVHAATGTSRCAPPASPSATRPTASCTSASDARPLMRRVWTGVGRSRWSSPSDSPRAAAATTTHRHGPGDAARAVGTTATPDTDGFDAGPAHDPRPAAGRGHQGHLRARQRHRSPSPRTTTSARSRTAPRCRS